MRKIKIIEVIADSSLSGAPKHLLTLISLLDQKRYYPILICPRGWLSSQAKQKGIKVINIGMNGFFDLPSIFKLKKTVKMIDPDLIHLHGLRAGWLGVVSWGKNINRLIYTEHLYTKNYHLESSIREWIQLKGLSYIIKKMKIIIVPSSAVKDFLVEKFKINDLSLAKSRDDNIKVIYNGLEDLSRGVSHPAFGAVRDDLKVGFIGSLNRQKGVIYLIKAFNQLCPKYPGVKLEIIGDGPLKNELSKLADGNIIFLGEKKNIIRHLSQWQMIIIPSLSESFGQTAVEAAIFSKPVVASRVGGLPEVVINKKTGLLVKPRKAKELVGAISYLLSHPNEALKMGKVGRKRYLELFTAEKMVRKVENIYEKIYQIFA